MTQEVKYFTKAAKEFSNSATLTYQHFSTLIFLMRHQTYTNKCILFKRSINFTPTTR